MVNREVAGRRASHAHNGGWWREGTNRQVLAGFPTGAIILKLDLRRQSNAVMQCDLGGFEDRRAMVGMQGQGMPVPRKMSAMRTESPQHV